MCEHWERNGELIPLFLVDYCGGESYHHCADCFIEEMSEKQITALEKAIKEHRKKEVRG